MIAAYAIGYAVAGSLLGKLIWDLRKALEQAKASLSKEISDGVLHLLQVGTEQQKKIEHMKTVCQEMNDEWREKSDDISYKMNYYENNLKDFVASLSKSLTDINDSLKYLESHTEFRRAMLDHKAKIDAEKALAKKSELLPQIWKERLDKGKLQGKNRTPAQQAADKIRGVKSKRWHKMRKLKDTIKIGVE